MARYLGALRHRLRGPPGCRIRPGPRPVPVRPEGVRSRAQSSAVRSGINRDEKTFNDTNYIFLGFVTNYLPAGIVGLIMAAIFAAAMSTISAEVNSLATVTVIDVYQRFLRRTIRRATTCPPHVASRHSGDSTRS